MNTKNSAIGARKIARYGWQPDLPDARDHFYAAPVEMAGAIPAKVDQRAQCPPVYDQGQLGSCTANAIAAALEFDRLKQKLDDFAPSRLFIYYNERAMEHTIDSDSGAQIRDGIKSVGKSGDCPETEWPYVIAKFKTKPPKNCYADALKYKAVLYQRLTPILTQLKGCLASGYPFVFGFTVYESFESAAVAKSGHAPLPKSGEQSIGGHAVVGVGYDDAKQWFIVRNSWGNAWGMKGYEYGFCNETDGLYSCVLNEIICGQYSELAHFTKQLNDRFLFTRTSDIEMLIAARLNLLKKSADLEHGDMSPWSVWLYDLSA